MKSSMNHLAPEDIDEADKGLNISHMKSFLVAHKRR